MPLVLTWEQIAIRLLLASIASFIIGLNRDEHGHPAGIRTTMLVCLAATLAMLQVKLLLPLAGKDPSSFVVMDLMRLPLGILSGIGFIGAGVIVKRGVNVSGVTTAATMWFITVVGLLFGAGNLYLGSAASIIAFVVLWAIRHMENYLPREHHATLQLVLSPDAPGEADFRRRLLAEDWTVTNWAVLYDPPTALSSLNCELKWNARIMRVPTTPQAIEQLRTLPGVRSLSWTE
jgi:putative Mg2+ transporter-C (MgtC) family protein